MIGSSNLIGTKHWCALAVIAGAAVITAIPSQNALGASFFWGTTSDPAGDVMFTGMTETHDEPPSHALFAPNPGDGGPFASGNNLILDPQNFAADASGDFFVDSTFTTVVMAKPGRGVENVKIDEAGDYSLFGGGYGSAAVGAAFFFTVLEVDGAPIDIEVVTDKMLVTTGAGAYGGEYSLPGDSGLAQIWEGSVFFDVDAHLASRGIFGQATKVRVRFDNALAAFADPGTTAFIKKKENGIIIRTNVPEPSTVVLITMAGMGLLAAHRFRG